MIKCFPELTPRTRHLAKLVQQPGTKDMWLFIGNEKQKKTVTRPDQCDHCNLIFLLEGYCNSFISESHILPFLWCKKTQNWKSFQGKIKNIRVSIPSFQIPNNMVNSTARHAGCDPKLTLTGGIISFNNLWIINEKSNSGIWAKRTKLLFQIKQTNKKIIQ